MNIYNYLKKDHEKVNMLFEQIISARTTEKREEYFLELKEELLLHADAEHKTFYKALKAHEETKDLSKHGDKEHAEVKEYLEKLSALSSPNDKWMELLGELKHAVAHHVKDEEEEMFKKAKKVFTKEQETSLVSDIEAEKQKLAESV